MAKPLACTIVSNNYVPYARVLATSFLDRNPEGTFHTLIVDEPSPEIDYEAEPFTVTFAHDLEIPSFPTFAFRYSILELNTAVKPYYLEALHRQTECERLCYFDPDILVTASLETLYDELEPADVALTPHVLEPLDDDKLPSERDFLLSGIYNLGFLGMSFNDRTLSFLDWWQRRLYVDCRHEVERGLFVDQRWMDFAPAFLSGTKILRDPGLNVAYWNLAHRRPERVEGEWQVGGSPLRFFHFSGFSPEHPEGVSRFQNRYTLDDRPELRELFEDYAERLFARGYRELESLPYAYGTFDNGDSIPSPARRALRDADPDGVRWPNPFATAGDSSFYAWLAEAADPSATVPLPRIGHALWEVRTDLQAAFPEPFARDAVPFARWILSEGRAEAGIPAGLCRRLDEALQRSTVTPLGGAAAVETDSWRHWTSDLLARSNTADLATGFEGLDRSARQWLLQEASLEASRQPRVPRVAMMIHKNRSDLQHQFPDPLASDRAGFARWFATYGQYEYRLPAAIVRAVARTLPLRSRLSSLWWGVKKALRPTTAGASR